LFNNDVKSYQIKKNRESSCVCEQVYLISYYSIGQILKLVHKKIYKNIGLYQRPVTDIRGHIYNSIPVIEYSSPIWHPSKKQQISQVEQIQRKAPRYVFNNYRDRSPGAVTNMIDTLQCSLACRRTKASLILLYKVNGGLVKV
jgi:hypothetical protein